jgi:penicillin-insensitive murein endopeptidase
LILSSATLVLAATDNPWPGFATPAPGPARAIGEYSAGCLQGARELPLDGAGYRLMHPSRNRVFGHPALLEFVRALGRGVRKLGLSVVLIGDLSQPRGGRAPGGHASHQSGLDVDVWYWAPRSALKGPLTLDEREQLAARSILDGRRKRGVIRREWNERVAGLLRVAADDGRVERIFVHPAIKRELCAGAGSERAFLHKLRPWHGHDDHFHARLACPADSPQCKPQAPLAPGDGCDELGFWLDASAQAERKRAQEEYQHKVVAGRGWPAECEALLVEPQ